MNLKQKIELYDRLYKRADDLLKEHNPCKMKDGKCLRGEPCCDGCEHLTKNGCVIECLMCKLHLCHRVTRRNPELVKIFRQMCRKADRYGLLHARLSKKETIKILQKNRKKKENS